MVRRASSRSLWLLMACLLPAAGGCLLDTHNQVPCDPVDGPPPVADVGAHQVIEAADPAPHVILETARHEQADLIALGTHAKAGMSRLVLGSVSEELLERSPIPVLLVHQRPAASTDAPSSVAGASEAPANQVGVVSSGRLA